jgi:multimeric flavodoxin WrbA
MPGIAVEKRFYGNAVMPLKAFAFNCTLKPSPKKSSTDKILQEIFDALGKHGVACDGVRAVDFNIKPGVKSDEGQGDDWPDLRKRMLAADIVILGCPIWLGQPSSVAKRVMERMDAFFDEKDVHDRMPSYGKVALAAIVGNEDGAHHVSAEVFQALNDVGFTIPANGMTYWVGEAMGSVNYIDLKKTPKTTDYATRLMVDNAVHLAGLLKKQNYPGLKSKK